MPPPPPLKLALSLLSTLLLASWFAGATMQAVRPEVHLAAAMEQLSTRAEGAWRDLDTAARQANPPDTTPVPAAHPAPTLATMLGFPAVKAAYHLSPALVLTYQARGRMAYELDMRTWRPATMNMAAWLGPEVQPALAAADEEVIACLAQPSVLGLRSLRPDSWFHRLTRLPRHHLMGKAGYQGGWLGFDTSVVEAQGAASILANHGLDGVVDWSFKRNIQGQATYSPFDSIWPKGPLTTVLDGTVLVPIEGFGDFAMTFAFTAIAQITALVAATVTGIGISIRQVRNLLRLNAVADARGRFVSGMSHEMRTPLTTIKLYAEMLQHGVIGDEARRKGYLATIARECDRLSWLVDNTLAYAALENRTIPLTILDVDAKEALEAAVDAARGPLEQAGLEVQVHAPVPLRLAADRDALVRAIANLLTNAAKYAADGRVVLLSALPAEDDPTEAVITVRDFGPGVPTAERTRIFEPFYRSPHPTASGTGLGLAIVQETVTGHGGQIEVGGEPGQGAEFRLRLPLAANPAEPRA